MSLARAGWTAAVMRCVSGLNAHACPMPPVQSSGAISPMGQPPPPATSPTASNAAPITIGPRTGSRSRTARRARVHVRLAVANPVAYVAKTSPAWSGANPSGPFR